MSGYTNFSAAIDARDRLPSLGEAEIEVTPHYKLPSGTILAIRSAVNATAAISGNFPSQLSIPEASVFAIGSFGRIEVGYRAGFPQSLNGFTPSEIAFTSAEYGPESGRRLDPDGRLPTAFLGVPVQGQIDRLSYLGYAARFYGDRSAKIIYLSPRLRNGVYGAISFTPRTDRPNGFNLAGPQAGLPALSYRDLVQAALVWTHRTESVEIALGSTLSRAVTLSATGAGPAASTDPARRQATSLSGGLSATLHDRWALGLSATYDGWSSRAANDPARHRPYGVVASLNYVDGPWIAGGYYQHIAAAANTSAFMWDNIDIVQVGLSWFADRNHDLIGPKRYTDAKLFGSIYYFDTERQAQYTLPIAQRGVVALAGMRFSFF